jgi:hypothetical protein
MKDLLPAPLRRQASRAYWAWHNRGRHQLAGALSPRLRASRRALQAMRDRHRGERCFILGNGPSLASMDLSLLRGETTFGMNRIYLLFPSLGFRTTYYVAVNELVIEQCAPEIRALRGPMFITWRARRWLPRDSETIFLDTDYTGAETFSTDLRGRVFEGSTVTFVALQIAYHLGFEDVVLIGVDHRFTAGGEPNAPVVSAGDDPDHFSKGYFGKGFRWPLPALVGSERACRVARQAFETAGRRVVDATVGGKLEVFPKVDYLSLFGSERNRKA